MRSVPALAVALLVVTACGHDRPMAEGTEMSDSTSVSRAMHDAKARDSMLDTMPGGEMVRGDSTAAERLLKQKM